MTAIWKDKLGREERNKQTWRKKIFGFPRKLGQRSAVMVEVRVLMGTHPWSDPRMVPSFPWLIRTHTKQDMSVWLSSDTGRHTVQKIHTGRVNKLYWKWQTCLPFLSAAVISSADKFLSNCTLKPKDWNVFNNRCSSTLQPVLCQCGAPGTSRQRQSESFVCESNHAVCLRTTHKIRNRKLCIQCLNSAKWNLSGYIRTCEWLKS